MAQSFPRDMEVWSSTDWETQIWKLTNRAYDVRDFGAKADGLTDDGPAFQIALDAAGANAASGSGATTVRVPAGTYTMGLRKIPGQSGTTIAAAGCWIPSGVTLDLSSGATIKLKDNAQLPAGCTTAHIVTVTTPWLRPAAGGTIKKNVRLLGGVIDGNGNNNTSLVIYEAVALHYCDGAQCIGTKVQNVYGTMPGPPGETFAFAAYRSINTEWIACEADGSGATDTASGFADDYSFGTTYVACRAHDLAHGQGFTHYQTTSPRYIGCYGYRCGASGFNSELSKHVSYAGCISGGEMVLTANGTTLPMDWFPQNGDVSMANAWGWKISGSTYVTLDSSCQSSSNVSGGVNVYSNISVSPSVICDQITVGGAHLFNGSGITKNLVIERAADGGGAKDQGNVQGVGSFREDLGAHTLAAVSPVLDIWAAGGNGGRIRLRKTSFIAGAYSLRIARENDASNADFAISDIGQVVTRGRCVNRTAQAGNYTMVATDEYVGCTGTGSTAQTITLPAVANVGAGTVYTIKDEAGGAAAHNITITPNGAETIDGAASAVISANRGVVRLICTGTGWAAI